MEAGCLVALAEQLRDSRSIPEPVLSEVSAALAVLASHRKSLPEKWRKEAEIFKEVKGN